MFLKLSQIILLVTVFVWPVFTNASTDFNQDNTKFKLSGFGTLGVVTGGDEELGFQRDWSRANSPVSDGDWSAKQDSLFGLQLDARFTDKLSGGVQLVVRDRLDNSPENSLEWAFLNYHLTTNTSVRGGRMGVDLFMLSDHRNVGFTYLWARPPIEFYGQIPFDHFDGMDVTHTMPLWDGDLSVKIFGGISKNTQAGKTEDSSLNLEPIYGANVLWENNSWLARIGIATATLESSSSDLQLLQDYLAFAAMSGWSEASSISDDLELSDKNIYYYSAGIAYDSTPWQVQSEISFIDSEYDFFQPLINTYISVAHQFGPVALYSVAALSKNTKDPDSINSAPPQWTALQGQIQGVHESSRIDQKSLSFGIRWDIRYDLSLKLQWDRHWGKHGGSLWYHETGVDENRTLDTFSLNLNFVF